ncbi:MAG TPA: AMP-binding protein [Stellaceae bacterium]|nr:AMP-binding protein [Stellaceae bacterium]
MSAAATLPQLVRRNAREMAGRPAMREKDLGIWQTLSWAQYYAAIGEFALGLAATGFRRGDKLTVIGDNRPHLYMAQLAAQCLGGIAVPVYQDSIAAELLYVLNHAEISVVVAEDQEQVDKILSLNEQLPNLRLVIYDDPRGMLRYDLRGLHSFEEITAQGKAFGAAHPDYLDAEIDAGAGSDLAVFSYTSGTTGHPKGVMLSHHNLIFTAQAYTEAESFTPIDDMLSYLPMAWIGESLFSLVLSPFVGFACNCPERPETVGRDLRELGPRLLVGPPRVWENMLTSVRIRAGDASRLKRRAFDFFRALAERAEAARSAGGRPSPWQRLGLALGEFFVYRPVRDQLGLARTRFVYTGGAPLGPDTFRFFRSFGINIKEVWGATELAGVASVQPDGEADPDTVGRMLPGSEVRIAEDGEVQVRSEGLFVGYYRQPEATAAALTEDGWFRSGDSGFIDARGHLVIIDRAKDVGRLSDGTPFAPQFVENKLKFSPFIGEVVAFGDRLPFVAAIVAIDRGTVGSWAERHSLAYTSFQDLSAKPEIRQLIAAEIVQTNAGLPAAARIRRFLLLNKEFDADDNEITRTRKIRRRFVAEKYAAIVEALYGGAEEIEVSSEITFEDGRKATITSRLAIADVEDGAPAAREPAYA